MGLQFRPKRDLFSQVLHEGLGKSVSTACIDAGVKTLAFKQEATLELQQ